MSKNSPVTVLFLTVLLLRGIMSAQDVADPYIWLESIDGDKALDWVHAHNDSTMAALKQSPMFGRIYEKNLEVYNSVKRIAYPEVHGRYVYNFWKDERNERGIWRRTTVAEYRTANPVWEVVLDVDSLGKAEGENWVFAGADYLYPDYNRCMLSLSRGGSDASVIREFDLRTKRFVKGGFTLPESKGGTSWRDENTLIVSSCVGKDATTRSGYPRLARLWSRGTSIENAPAVFAGDTTDMVIWGYTINTPERQYVFITQAPSMFTSNVFALEKGELVKLDIPIDAGLVNILQNQVILQLKTDWNTDGVTYVQGSLVSVDYTELLRGRRQIRIVWMPDGTSSINSVSTTKHVILVNTLNNVRGEIFECALQDGRWSAKKAAAPEFGTIEIVSADPDSDQYFFSFTNFLTPQSLYWADPLVNEVQKVKTQPDFFDAGRYAVRQLEIPSKDGTKIPYFLVARKDIAMNGGTPTILKGYGGFEVPYVPEYVPADGYAWLDHGGAIVVANIRGGGEFGPRWHLGAMKENRQKVYDDFYAVAEDLIRRKITSKEHLGILGGSNGGLLVGVAFTQRPDLFRGVACLKPLLDMRRYSKLLAGASWMDEYGDPDKPEEWAYIRKYSPYQNLAAGRKYPRVLFVTSTRDDRVHPAHARKMAAKMEDLGYRVYFYENTEGGHAVTSTNKERAFIDALTYTYFLNTLR
jgi:prolyl oligopeptidase